MGPLRRRQGVGCEWEVEVRSLVHTKRRFKLELDVGPTSDLRGQGPLEIGRWTLPETHRLNLKVLSTPTSVSTPGSLVTPQMSLLRYHKGSLFPNPTSGPVVVNFDRVPSTRFSPDFSSPDPPSSTEGHTLVSTPLSYGSSPYPPPGRRVPDPSPPDFSHDSNRFLWELRQSFPSYLDPPRLPSRSAQLLPSPPFPSLKWFLDRTLLTLLLPLSPTPRRVIKILPVLNSGRLQTLLLHLSLSDLRLLSYCPIPSLLPRPLGFLLPVTSETLSRVSRLVSLPLPRTSTSSFLCLPSGVGESGPHPSCQRTTHTPFSTSSPVRSPTPKFQVPPRPGLRVTGVPKRYY